MRAEKTFGIKCLAFHAIKGVKVLLNILVLAGGLTVPKIFSTLMLVNCVSYYKILHSFPDPLK